LGIEDIGGNRVFKSNYHLKPGTNIKAVWLWSLAAAILVTISGSLYRFNYETTWAYAAIGVVAVGLTLYMLITKKS
jgi:uncharacterized membrane protein YfcA